MKPIRKEWLIEMNNQRKKSISYLLTLLLILNLFTAVFPIKVYAADPGYVSFKYDNFSSNQSLIKLNGQNGNGAAFVADSGQQVLRLTRAAEWQNGSAYYKNYVSLSNKRSFSTFFTFNMGGVGGLSDPGINTQGADGIVFVLNNTTNSLGKPGGGMGYEQIVNSVGIEFDTWLNGGDSTTNFGDGGLSANHIAVNKNGVPQPPVATAINSTFRNWSFKDGRTYYVWIDYNGPSHTLQVRINDTNDRSNACMPINIDSINLNDGSTLNSDNIYVGFSAGTGLAYENHDIRSWYFCNDYQPIDTSVTTYIQRPTGVTLSASPSSNTTSTVLKATVKNADGTNAAAGIPVTFSVVSGPNGTFDSTPVNTDANGEATVNFSGTSVLQGTAVVKAAAQGGAYGQVTINNFGVAPSLAINTSNPTTGTVGTAYSSYTFTATGGTGTKTYAVASGTLPAGLTLAADGTLSGTPTTSGSSTFTVTVTDNGPPMETSNHQYTMTIANLEVAPTLSAGAVARTGDATATIKFTSDEAGQYYYAIVDDGAEAPVIDTTGSGTACTTSETTITNPTGLTAGARDIYIKVKDAAGSVSSALKIDIPAFVPVGPSWVSPYPKKDTMSNTSGTMLVKTNVGGTVYYVVLPHGSPAPSASEVAGGTGSSGTISVASGSITVAANTEQTINLTGLSSNTVYNVYLVAKDTSSNLQAAPVEVNVATNILVYYNFDGNTNDISGNGNNGSISGNVTYESGYAGQAASFDGLGGYVKIPDGLLHQYPNFTVIVRFRTTNYGAILGYQTFINRLSGDGDAFTPILSVRTDHKLYCELWVGGMPAQGGKSMSVISTNNVDDGNWHKVALSGGTNSIALYLDDVKIGGQDTGGITNYFQDLCSFIQ